MAFCLSNGGVLSESAPIFVGKSIGGGELICRLEGDGVKTCVSHELMEDVEILLLANFLELNYKILLIL